MAGNYGITLDDIRTNGKQYVFDGTTALDGILAVQTALRVLGYWGSPDNPDSKYGNYTVAAVRGFQKENGLAVTGNFNKTTLTKMETFTGTLIAGHSTTPTITRISKGLDYAKLNDKGPAITTISEKLKSLGYLTSTTSTFNTTLQTAVRKFQSEKGLSVDGAVGQATYAVLLYPTTGNWFSNGKATLNPGILARCGFNNSLLLPTFITRLNSAMSTYGVNTKVKVRHFLTQVCAETMKGWGIIEMRYMAGVGIAGKSYSPYAGGGFFHLTGETNYKSFYDYMCKKGKIDDQIITPDIYATQHVAISYPGDSAGWFWTQTMGEIDWSLDYNSLGKIITDKVFGASGKWPERKPLFEKIQSILT